MSLPSIDLSVSQRLKTDKKFRQRFFLAEASAKIAQQLIALRTRRELNQTQVAKKLETRQPAISRVESADYRNWSFNTLRKLAEAMDARIRVVIEPAEDVLHEYEEEDAEIAKPVPVKDSPTKGNPKTSEIKITRKPEDNIRVDSV